MALTPISPVGAALRAQIVGAAQSVMAAAVGAAKTSEVTAAAPVQPARPATAEPVVAPARAEAAARQGSLAPLLADLPQALAAPATPPAVRTVATALLNLLPPAGQPITPQVLRQALASSGLFLEARLAQTPRGRPPAPDMKGALLALKAALAQTPTEPTEEGPHHAPARPPSRDAALQGQPPAAPTLTPAADPARIAQVLAPQVEQALARQTLHQLASLPEPGGAAWMFELPLGTPLGAAIAQFEISREDPPPDSPEAREVWRARFSMDVEPLGPVHVHLSLAAERPTIAIWAEREEGAAWLRGESAALTAMLPADVVIRTGAPNLATPGPGAFVDSET